MVVAQKRQVPARHIDRGTTLITHPLCPVSISTIAYGANNAFASHVRTAFVEVHHFSKLTLHTAHFEITEFLVIHNAP